MKSTTPAIVFLEDEDQYRASAEGFIQQWDAQSIHIEVRSVEEAKQALQNPLEWLRGSATAPAVAAGSGEGKVVVVGAIIDLLIESATRGRRTSQLQQGLDLIRWLHERPEFAGLPVLILSLHEEMIREVERHFHVAKGGAFSNIRIVSRGDDYYRIRSAIRDFIEALPIV